MTLGPCTMHALPSQPDLLVPLPLRISLLALVFVPKTPIPQPSRLPTLRLNLMSHNLAMVDLQQVLMWLRSPAPSILALPMLAQRRSSTVSSLPKEPNGED